MKWITVKGFIAGASTFSGGESLARPCSLMVENGRRARSRSLAPTLHCTRWQQLNDVTYVEAARAMAERALHAAPADETAQIGFVFRLATARTPSNAERDRLQNRLLLLTEHFRSNPEAAGELLKLGESSRDERLSSPQHAALTCVCLLILNLDETLTN